MNKIFKYLVFSIVFFIIPISVRAINIDSVSMDVYLDKNGDAHVSETWTNPYPNSGDTEFYKAYDNLGEMKITDFTVSYNNQTFTYNEDWDINESFDEKAYKNGLYYEDEKTELCFGITSYDSGIYNLKYTIKNFVVKLKDNDMVYFNFIPSGNNINKFYLKMYADESFSEKLPVWGFGKKNGTAYVYDGYIEMNSESIINSDEYITLLVQFDKDTFKSNYSINKKFNYYLNMAKKGSSTPIQANPVFKFIKNLFAFLFRSIWYIFFVVIAFIGVKSSKNKVGSYKFDFGKNGRKLPKEINKIRDIPFDDIYKVYLYATVYNFNNKKTDLLGAVLLKWLKEDKVKLTKGLSKILKKEETNIVFNKDTKFENNIEISLFNMLYEASKDGTLESKELEKWCKNNYDEILKWFDRVLDFEVEKLINEGVLERMPGDSKIHVTDKFIEEAILTKGVKEFLLEFSRIDDKEAIEVKLWEMYLIYAQVFGIANKVAKQFKKLYPEEIKDFNERYGYGIDDILFISYISSSGVSAATSSRDRANSYSSGGGGFMSGGGGGGSFGGGGSMGSR